VLLESTPAPWPGAAIAGDHALGNIQPVELQSATLHLLEPGRSLIDGFNGVHCTVPGLRRLAKQWKAEEPDVHTTCPVESDDPELT
jgi:hypothetical protein